MNVTILGAGSWGSALSLVLSNNNLSNIQLYNYDNYYSNNSSYKYLDNINIPSNVNIINSIDKICNTDFIFIALPTQYINETLSLLSYEAFSNKNTIWVNCSKGFDLKNKNIFSKTLTKEFNIHKDNFVVLSGPSHAEEVSQKIPTAVVASSLSKTNSSMVQKLLSNNYFRVYTNTDVIGVEIGGACKNIISIAAGICIGLGYGDNTISALISRGLQEIIRLGVTLNANTNTFYGLSGLGDLSVTAFGKFSRNRQFGIKLGEGVSFKQANIDINMVIEGVNATKIVTEMSKKYKINMPIVDQVYSILFNNKNPKLAINELMDRKLKDEMI